MLIIRLSALALASALFFVGPGAAKMRYERRSPFPDYMCVSHPRAYGFPTDLYLSLVVQDLRHAN